MTVVVSSLEGFLHLVQDGRGIACVLDLAVKDALSEERLAPVLDAYMTRSITFRIAVTKDIYFSGAWSSPMLRAFRFRHRDPGKTSL